MVRNRPGATSTMMPTPRTSREKTRDTFAGAVTTQNFKPAALQGFCQARCRTRTDNRLITSEVRYQLRQAGWGVQFGMGGVSATVAARRPRRRGRQTRRYCASR